MDDNFTTFVSSFSRVPKESGIAIHTPCHISFVTDSHGYHSPAHQDHQRHLQEVINITIIFRLKDALSCGV